ncbi:suppressor of glycerol defect [Ascosphaera acerosa]|nr:suppressor of glycerol defect [Ascosphaera acerosa]
MAPRRHNTTQLPRALREELGLPDSRGNGRPSGRSLSRKDARKAERQQKRGGGRGRQAQPPATAGKRHHALSDGRGKYTARSYEEDDEASDAQEIDAHRKTKRRRVDQPAEKDGGRSKTRLEPAEQASDIEVDLDESDISLDGYDDGSDVDERSDDVRAQPLSPRKISKSVQQKLEEDDAEIARLEKLLGIKGKKSLPKSFTEDGLGELLGDLPAGLGFDDDDKARRREEEEWLAEKRRKAQKKARPGASRSDDESDDAFEGFNSDDEAGAAHEDDSEEEEVDEGSEADGMSDEQSASDPDDESDDESDSEDSTVKDAPRVKENPYVAPVSSSQPATQKYIPPSLRARANDDSEAMVRLRRQAQGHLNKLSDANLVSILGQFEVLYTEHPRQNVTTTVINLLFDLIYTSSFLQDSFILLHAGFIAAMYRVIGMDFGAEFLQRFVERFDADYETASKTIEAESGDDQTSDLNDPRRKAMINAMALLSHLYNFHMVGCGLIFEYIKLFLSQINGMNTEFLLKIIKNSGPQLRSDDPSSLKDIVLLIQPAVASIGEENLATRTKFMIEMITQLKNNRLKSGAAASANVSSDHITRLRKALGALSNSRSIRASEPLRIGRADIHNSSKKGKWWLVGASWKSDEQVNVDSRTAQSDIERTPTAQTSSATAEAAAINIDDDLGDPDAVNLLQLARSHRMNTDVRRSIFIAILSASDYRDAHTRLVTLHLKRKQEAEIPRVLLHCASKEDAYNPYYTLIARQLCGDRRMKMAFMFALWDYFRRMGESTDVDEEAEVDEEGGEAVNVKAIVNLAKMFADLIVHGQATLGVLKVLDFAYLQEKTAIFVEVLLVTLILQSLKSKKATADQPDEKALLSIMAKVGETPQIATGLIYFLRTVVSKTDVVTSKKDKVLVKHGCKLALQSLKSIDRAEVTEAA